MGNVPAFWLLGHFLDLLLGQLEQRIQLLLWSYLLQQHSMYTSAWLSYRSSTLSVGVRAGLAVGGGVVSCHIKLAQSWCFRPLGDRSNGFLTAWRKVTLTCEKGREMENGSS